MHLLVELSRMRAYFRALKDPSDVVSNAPADVLNICVTGLAFTAERLLVANAVSRLKAHSATFVERGVPRHRRDSRWVQERGCSRPGRKRDACNPPELAYRPDNAVTFI